MKQNRTWAEAYARGAQAVFQPALTPLEAAMLPADAPRSRAALAMARASFAPGERRREPDVRLPRLPGWGPHRQKI